eukprot:1141695-Pelagomonas_calceolata.AAC.6
MRCERAGRPNAPDRRCQLDMHSFFKFPPPINQEGLPVMAALASNCHFQGVCWSYGKRAVETGKICRLLCGNAREIVN